MSFSHFFNVPNLLEAKLIEGNGYEIRQSPLLHVFVHFFGLDPAQNTIVVYSLPSTL